jgi:hypothetical protein
MTQYLVVAVTHASGNEDGRLLSPECEEAFRTRITPQLLPKTLILMEGFDSAGIFGPEHRAHSIACREFGEALSGFKPTFGGFDSRERPDTGDRLDAWEYFVKNNVLTDWSVTPATNEHAEELIRAKPLQASLRRQPTHEEVGLARWVDALSRRFDREYISAMRKYGPRYDMCVVVVGSVHAISLRLKTGYPIEYAFGDHEAKGLYYAYHGDYVWPPILFSRKD